MTLAVRRDDTELRAGIERWLGRSVHNISRPAPGRACETVIVDDEPGVRTSLTGVLRDEGYSVDAVASGEECLDRLPRTTVDLIVIDVWLPRMDGPATLARSRYPPGPSPAATVCGPVPPRPHAPPPTTGTHGS